MNRQRETIYAERDKVLHNEDLTESVRGFLDEELEVLVDAHAGGTDTGAWDMAGLANALEVMGLGGPATSEDELWEVATGRDTLVAHLQELADAKLEAKENEHGDEVWSQVERVVLLRTIDSLWVEHLTELDDMRRGIGLRGYAQQDPLNEYRREAFRMYEEFRDLIRHQVASSIFRVTVQKQPAPAVGGDPAGAAAMAAGVAALTGARARAAAGARAGSAAAGAAAATPAPSGVRNVQERLGDGPATNGSGAGAAEAAPGQARPGYTPTGERIGRNDPCWCGSGAKYKKCHGR
jgi:preprotein translocase subunit SecA